MKYLILAIIGSLSFVFYAPITAADQSGAAAVPQQTILALGDSLVAGYGLPPGDGFTDQLADALNSDDGNSPAVSIINAGVSGDTSAGGLARLGWIMDDTIDLLIITLGGNDVLRALPPEQTYANLGAIITQARAQLPDLPILLTGMMAPPNLGEEYAAAFNPVYQKLAADYDVALYPFFLEGVAADPTLNQADGIHPNKEGVAVIITKILPHVKAALAETPSIP
ncbi:MAG: arylesterase [Alphaproteobacteria bacterium]